MKNNSYLVDLHHRDQIEEKAMLQSRGHHSNLDVELNDYSSIKYSNSFAYSCTSIPREECEVKTEWESSLLQNLNSQERLDDTTKIIDKKVTQAVSSKSNQVSTINFRTGMSGHKALFSSKAKSTSYNRMQNDHISKHRGLTPSKRTLKQRNGHFWFRSESASQRTFTSILDAIFDNNNAGSTSRP